MTSESGPGCMQPVDSTQPGPAGGFDEDRYAEKPETASAEPGPSGNQPVANSPRSRSRTILLVVGSIALLGLVGMGLFGGLLFFALNPNGHLFQTLNNMTLSPQDRAQISEFRNLCISGAAVDNLAFTVTLKEQGESDKIRRIFMKDGYVRVIRYQGDKIECILIYDPDEKVVTEYNNDSKRACQFPLSQEKADNPYVPLPRYWLSGANPYTARYLGKESLSGRNARVYEYLDQEGPVKVWLWEENGLPLKMEGKNQYGHNESIVMSDIDLTPLDQSIFRVPEGLSIYESNEIVN